MKLPAISAQETKTNKQTNQFTKASLTLNYLLDAICMTHNRFSDFHCVCTFIQVVHTEFIKVGTEYLAFMSLSKMSPEQAASAVIIAQISKENMSKKKKQKIEV